MMITPTPLTKENFKPFGEVFSPSGDFQIINNGFAKKHSNLITIDSKEKDGFTAVNIFIAKKREFPLKINMLEKHPHHSQAFFPRSSQPFLVVVAPPSDIPQMEDIKVFITDGNQGVNYFRQVWHFPLISLHEGEQFLVIDRTDRGMDDKKINELKEYFFDDESLIQIKLF